MPRSVTEPQPADQPTWPSTLRLIQPNLRLPDARDLDVAQLIETVVDYGANAVLLNGGGMVAWYPTRLPYQRVNPYLAGDFLGSAIDAAHRHELKALARIDATKTYPEFFNEHPDWFRKGPHGGPVQVGPFYETCMNGPFWQEHSFAIIGEMLDRYPADGIFFNSFLYRACQAPCASCDVALRQTAETHGIDDSASPSVRHAWMASFAHRLRAFVEQRRPGATISMDMEVLGDNPAHSRASGWSRDLWSLQEPVVAIAFNRLTRPHPLWPYQAGENARYLRATLGDRSTCVLLTYSGVFGNRRVAQPRQQLAYDIIQTAASGAGVGLQLMGTFEQDDARALPAVKETFRYLRDHEAVYSRARPAARVALAYSQRTADAYGGEDPVGWVLDEYRGWYRALSEGHQFFDVVDDAFLETGLLDRYETVVLPNVAALSETACARLDDFAQKGGRLIATFETSLFTERGTPRADFGLGGFGCRYERSISAPGSYLAIENPSLALELEGARIVGLGAETPYGGFGPLAFGPPESKKPGPVQEAVFVMTAPTHATGRIEDFFWVPPVTNNIPEFSYWENVSRVPGLHAGPFGSGHVTYLPWMPGRLAFRYALPGLAPFLAGLVARSSSSAPITISGPSVISATLGRLEPGGWLVHLLNSAAAHTPSHDLLPAGPVTIRYEQRPAAVRSLLAGRALEVASVDGAWQTRLENVELFDAIVVELPT